MMELCRNRKPRPMLTKSGASALGIRHADYKDFFSARLDLRQPTFHEYDMMSGSSKAQNQKDRGLEKTVALS